MTSGGERTFRGVDDLEDLFREHADRIHAYARRHVGPDSADDVVSETFLVAWRRREVLPDRVLPWLIVTARHIIANQRRSGRRADQLWLSAVRDLWQAPQAISPDEAMIERERYLEALATCTRPEREALLLVAWEGLSLAEAAAVADCSVRAFTVRLSRARGRMRAAIGEDDSTRPTPLLAIAQELS